MEAKTPGKTYCFNKVCHRVKTIDETSREVGRTSILSASYYDDSKIDRFNPSNFTSSGEIFEPSRPDNAASPEYPDGTKLLVWSPETKKTLVVRVNNAGPYYGKRKLDLSRSAADTLGFRRRGVAKLHVRVLEPPTLAEARYQKRRTYAAVPGFVGIFETIDVALTSVGRALASLLVPPAVAATPMASAPRQARVRTASTVTVRHKAARTAHKASPRKHKVAKAGGRKHRAVAALASGTHKHKTAAYRASAGKHKAAAHKRSMHKMAAYKAKQDKSKRWRARYARS